VRFIVIFIVGLIFLMFWQPSASASDWKAFWVVRSNQLLSKAGIDEIISVHTMLGFDAAIVQINGRFEAYYPSRVVPSVSNLPTDFDPFEYFVTRAHEEGLEVHAWINALTAGSFGTEPEDPNHVLRTNPEWATHNNEGRSVIDYTPEQARVDVIPAVFLEPGLPEVQTYVTSVVREVASKYKVDGIHMDYVRYPTPNYGYHPVSRKRFASAYGIDPIDIPQQQGGEGQKEQDNTQLGSLQAKWDQFRRDNVTNMMRHIYWEVQRINPDIVVSAAVVSELNDNFALTHRFQDWPGWIEEGVIDVAFPMAYSSDPDVVLRQVAQAKERLGSCEDLVIGLGAYRIESPSELVSLMETIQREYDPRGIALFSYGSTVETENYLETLMKNLHDPSVDQ